MWNIIDVNQKKYIAPYLNISKSQYAQDLFIISEIAKRNLPKYFIEFGATNGISWSNTYLLEKFFEWEKKGVPLRVEYGPKDIEAHQCVVVRRDTGEKTIVPIDENISTIIDALLETIQSDLLKTAQKRLLENYRSGYPLVFSDHAALDAERRVRMGHGDPYQPDPA